jgi:hypothetical protein
MSLATSSRRIQAGAKALPVALVLAALTACTAEMPSPPGTTDRFVVESVRLTHRVAFPNGASGLSLAQQYELSAFLDETDPEGRAIIYLDAGGSERNGRIDAVAEALDSLGRESLGSGGAEGTKHGVTVTVMQDVLLPQACLDGDSWPHPDLPPASCTQALTLVQMVEDQNDLLRGRELGPALSSTAANAAARHYNKGAPEPADERPASVDPQSIPQLPPAPVTREASY